MFINCPNCTALVATDLVTDLPPARCPRCDFALRDAAAPSLPADDAGAAMPALPSAVAMPAPAAPGVIAAPVRFVPLREPAHAPLAVPAPVPASGAGPASALAPAMPPVAPASAPADGTAPNSSVHDASIDTEPDPRDPSDAHAVAPAARDPVATPAGVVAPGRREVADRPAGIHPAHPTDTAAPAAPAASTPTAVTPPAPVAATPLPMAPPGAPARTAPSFLRGTLPAGSPMSARERRVLLVSIPALALLLLLQLLLSDRVRLAADATWRPWVAAACALLPCSLPPWHEPDAIALVQRDVRPDPARPGVLQVSATLRNDAAHAQAWPMVLLTLSDVDGRPLGARWFAPEEYRPDGVPDTLAPGASAALRIDVVEPSPHTVAFNFDFG